MSFLHGVLPSISLKFKVSLRPSLAQARDYEGPGSLLTSPPSRQPWHLERTGVTDKGRVALGLMNPMLSGLITQGIKWGV